ncbi:right-handed parallel beta-helix repeat-containing protein [Streptomyces sp. NBC_01014]|uniref:right-handed parallel beta-helix repeat-containing protein n=1 Tax=Streptomyces sp. NBC_01014 TaxID=2903719 RepID=UPI00386DE2A5|nr:right-handed parallel beta-helix repeat-containing protein [Streptomyces sp. NBC_01014]
MHRSSTRRPGGRAAPKRLAAVAVLAAVALGAPALTATDAWAAHGPSGTSLYVSTSGNDHNSGSLHKPFRTLAAARTAARKATRKGRAVHVWVRGGTYHLAGTLTFDEADSGTASAPVTYSSYPGEKAVLSGGRRVTAAWSADPHNSAVQVAKVGAGLKIDGLFVGGTQQVLARFPNFDPNTAVLGGSTTMATLNARSAAWKNPTTGAIRGLHSSDWGGNDYTITGRSNSALQTKWVGDNNRGGDVDTNHVVAEGIFEELDAPGEWFYDKAAGKLYVIPPAGTDLSSATVETAELDELVRVEGSSAAKPVHDLTFDGFTYTETHRTLFDTPYEPLQLGDWAIARAGAVHLKNARNITVSRSAFAQVGGNGVFVDGYNKGDVITRNRFTGSGASDVQVVGSTEAVRNPSTWAHMVDPPTDLTPGPRTEDYPRDITVSYNSMADMGRFEKQSAGVNISMSSRVTVAHNTIHGSPRSGVNINDGTWGGHRIQYNDIFDCVKETSDHGPINAWGRDRYWPIAGPSINPSAESDALQKSYALLDVVQPITISNNRIWHNSEWAIDLDDGSSNYIVKNNLLLNAGIKLRDGFRRTVSNNILVNGSVYEQISHRDNDDSLTRNVILTGSPYSLTGSDPAAAKYTVDKNLFWDNDRPVALPDVWSAAKLDAHSVTADPQFTHGSPWDSPGMTDYTLASGSPAVALGFVNFPMDRFGTGTAGEATPPAVTWPAAPVPDTVIQTQPEPLMGATVRQVYDKATQSAVGLGDFDGLYLQAVPSTSYAYGQGLRPLDVIREVNGTAVTDRDSFWTVYNRLAPGSTVTALIWRAQSATTVTFVKPTGAQQYNNTAGVTYTGAGWGWRGARAGGLNSFQDDIDATTAVGDSFSFTFNGTGADLLTELNADEGTIDISVDGVFRKTVDATSDTREYQKTLYSVSGLSPGVHTLTGVMKSGQYMIVDGFTVRS